MALPGLSGGDLLLQGAGAHQNQGLPWTLNLPKGQAKTTGQGHHPEAQLGRKVWFLMGMGLQTLALGEIFCSSKYWGLSQIIVALR